MTRTFSGRDTHVTCGKPKFRFVAIVTVALRTFKVFVIMKR